MKASGGCDFGYGYPGGVIALDGGDGGMEDLPLVCEGVKDVLGRKLETTRDTT